jgi:hypothetical protein
MLKNGILQAGSVTANQHQACQFLHGKTEKSFLIMEQCILDTNAGKQLSLAAIDVQLRLALKILTAF